MPYLNSSLGFLTVPNAPCGVERMDALLVAYRDRDNVPNAPCGVESCFRACGVES